MKAKVGSCFIVQSTYYLLVAVTASVGLTSVPMHNDVQNDKENRGLHLQIKKKNFEISHNKRKVIVHQRVKVHSITKTTKLPSTQSTKVHLPSNEDDQSSAELIYLKGLST